MCIINIKHTHSFIVAFFLSVSYILMFVLFCVTKLILYGFCCLVASLFLFFPFVNLGVVGTVQLYVHDPNYVSL